VVLKLGKLLKELNQKEKLLIRRRKSRRKRRRKRKKRRARARNQRIRRKIKEEMAMTVGTIVMIIRNRKNRRKEREIIQVKETFGTTKRKKTCIRI